VMPSAVTPAEGSFMCALLDDTEKRGRACYDTRASMKVTARQKLQQLR
jgi:hypothetical protein